MNAVSRNDWTLHRKGPSDQRRHQEKVKEAIKKNLADIVSQESIILSDGSKIIKVPIRSLEEYKFRFDPRDKKGQVGQGPGGTQVGDVVGQDGDSNAPGNQAGSEPGVDYYEADVTLDELAAMIFEDLGLPNLEPRRSMRVVSDSVKFTDIRKAGILSNLDKKRTILENLRRNAAKGRAEFKDVRSDDLRFKTWEPDIRHDSNAVVLAMMDTSGSMGEFEKYIARSFYFWMVRFLRGKYENVEIAFLAHHTEAKEVTEEEFFNKGESGGTRASSVYNLALEVIRDRYPPSDWNIYPFHFSDGDNLFSDNDLCLKLVEDLLGKCNLFGYGEITQAHWSRSSTLMSVFSQIADSKFIGVTVSDKSDVYPALKRFFSESTTPA
ncbi:MAG TPA: sporulation protein YhbH [Armatimonadota bacterium]